MTESQEEYVRLSVEIEGAAFAWKELPNGNLECRSGVSVWQVDPEGQELAHA